MTNLFAASFGFIVAAAIFTLIIAIGIVGGTWSNRGQK